MAAGPARARPRRRARPGPATILCGGIGTVPAVRRGDLGRAGRVAGAAAAASSWTTCSGPTRRRCCCCDFALRRLPVGSVALLGAYRDVDPMPGPALAGLAVRMPGLRLPGLAPPAVGQLLADLLGAPAPPDVVAQVHERTGGNPFFVEQVSWLMATGEVGLPPGVRPALARRFDALPAATAAALGAAAVLGARFRVDVLADLIESTVDAVAADLAPAVAERLLIRDDRDGPDGSGSGTTCSASTGTSGSAAPRRPGCTRRRSGCWPRAARRCRCSPTTPGGPIRRRTGRTGTRWTRPGRRRVGSPTSRRPSTGRTPSRPRRPTRRWPRWSAGATLPGGAARLRSRPPPMRARPTWPGVPVMGSDWPARRWGCTRSAPGPGTGRTTWSPGSTRR